MIWGFAQWMVLCNLTAMAVLSEDRWFWLVVANGVAVSATLATNGFF